MADMVNLHAIFLVVHQLYDNGGSNNSQHGSSACAVTVCLSFTYIISFNPHLEQVMIVLCTTPERLQRGSPLSVRGS